MGLEGLIQGPRSLVLGFRRWGRIDGWTDGRTETGKFALCVIIGHWPLWGCCSKRKGIDQPTNQQTDGQTDKAGYRVEWHMTKRQ